MVSVASVSEKIFSIIVFCALFVVYTYIFQNPLYAQDDGVPSTSATTSLESMQGLEATTTPHVDELSEQYLETVYQRDGVPGDEGVVVGDFVVGPGKIDLTINPGETKTIFMTVTNRTGERRKFNLSFEDAVGSRNIDQSIILLGDDRGPYSLRDYLSVPSKSFILDHNTRARIPVTIHVPENAEPKGMYGSVLVDTVAIKAKPSENTGAEPQSAIIARVGTLFFITVPGQINYEGSLKEFGTLAKKKLFQSAPIVFGVVFENKGTTHLVPHGEVRIKNIFGEEVGYIQLDPWFVLPDSIRLREFSWDRDFLFGVYSATVYINRGYNNIIDEQTFTFWVLPWKIIGLICLALFLFFVIVRIFFIHFEFKRK